MEILSRMMTRADSGAGVRHGVDPRAPGSLRFNEIFGESLAESQSQITVKKPDAATTKETSTQPQKPERDKDVNEALAVGAVGNQTEVVFILEREKESATTPEIPVDPALEIGGNQTWRQFGAAETQSEPAAAESRSTQDAMETQPKPVPAKTPSESAAQETWAESVAKESGSIPTTLEPGTKAVAVESRLDLDPDSIGLRLSSIEAETQPGSINPGTATAETKLFTVAADAQLGQVVADSADLSASVFPIDAKKEPDVDILSGSAVAANPEAMAKQDAANALGNAANMVGEVPARTPNIRTSERQENEGQSFRFSKNGDLSPLENGNDTPIAEGQKGKTYPETAKAVQDTAAGAQDHINGLPPPLAEGIRPDQYRANQQMRQLAPVRAENLFDEMVSRVSAAQTESRSVMTIQLKPEFLGKVALEIAMDAAGLHVKISAADSNVRSMLNGQINALIESLGNKGIEVAKVEVAYTGVDNGANKESREGHSQPNRQRRSNREIDAADGVAYYTALPLETLDYYLEAGVSSVEYRA